MAWTAPRTWVAGEVLTASLLNTHLRDNLLAISDPWTPYTPTWTASGGGNSIGNGSVGGRYLAIGKTIHFYINFGVGSTTSVGTGRWDFSLPVTSVAYASLGHLIGYGVAKDNGVRNYHLDALYVGTTTVTGWRDAGATEATVTPTTPFTWATGDSLTLMGMYEAA